MNQSILIFDGASSSRRTEFAKSFSNLEYIPYYKFNTELDVYNDRNIQDIFDNVLYNVEPYMIEFLKQTNISIIFDKKYPSQWVYSKMFDRTINEELFRKIDDEFAKLGTIIVYCCNEKIEKELIHSLYLEFLNKITHCKVIAINTNEPELNSTNRLYSFIKMHNKLRDFKNALYKKYINYGKICGDKMLFIIEGEFNHLTKADIDKRLTVSSSHDFELTCVSQFENSDECKLLNKILLGTNINAFDISVIPIRKTSFNTISKLDIDVLTSEIDTLMPKNIITFSKNIADYISRIHEARHSKIKGFDVSMTHSSEIFENIRKDLSEMI